MDADAHQKLHAMLSGASPRNFGFAFELWTRDLVRQLIRSKFDVVMSISAVGALIPSCGSRHRELTYEPQWQAPMFSTSPAQMNLETSAAGRTTVRDEARNGDRHRSHLPPRPLIPPQRTPRHHHPSRTLLHPALDISVHGCTCPRSAPRKRVQARVFLPRADVVVTTGRVGATQQVLAAGVPVVVAGATDDKPFVAACIAARG